MENRSVLSYLTMVVYYTSTFTMRSLLRRLEVQRVELKVISLGSNGG
jgi:hypothetical protein